MGTTKIKFDHVEGSRRLRELRTDRGISIDTLVNETGINKQSLIDYEKAGKDIDKDSNTGRIDAFAGMSVNNLRILADYFGVSTDYLLCKTSVSSPSEAMQANHDYTGLSQAAIEHLHHYAKEQKPYPEYLEIMGELLSDAKFYMAIKELVIAKRQQSKLSERPTGDPDSFNMMQDIAEDVSDTYIMSDKNNGRNGEHLTLRKSVRFHLQEAKDCFFRECDKLIKGGA